MIETLEQDRLKEVRDALTPVFALSEGKSKFKTKKEFVTYTEALLEVITFFQQIFPERPQTQEGLTLMSDLADVLYETFKVALWSNYRGEWDVVLMHTYARFVHQYEIA